MDVQRETLHEVFSVENSIVYGILTCLIVKFVWELYLSIRQHYVYVKTVEVPNELEDYFPNEAFEKARIYGLDRLSFIMFRNTFGMVLSVSIMMLHVLAYFWNMAERVISSFGYISNNEIIQSMMFHFIFCAFDTVIKLPLVVYVTFVLEEKHGFNKQTVRFFIKDKFKSFVFTQITVNPMMAVMIYVVKIGGRYFFLYLWLLAVIMSAIMIFVYPYYVTLLFSSYTPLRDGELKTKIEELAASIDFPLSKLYVVKSSKRSAHSNAYFDGFYKNKRIIIFDTLLKGYTRQNQERGCDTDEVLAVLGHELGHWKLNHFWKHFIVMQLSTLLVFLVFGLMLKYDPMYRAFGFTTERPIIIGLIIVSRYIFSPIDAVIGFLFNLWSREMEFAADSFAVSLGKGQHLQRALIKLHIDNLIFPVYDWMYSMWHRSHPPLLERLKAIDKAD